MSLLKVTVSLLVIVLVIFTIAIGYFIYTMTIGDTLGLRERLDKLNGVVAVEDYHTYEGNAFFTLRLSGDKQIRLGGIGNQDLVRTDGMMLYQVGLYEIVCQYSPPRGGFSPGIHTSYISQDIINSIPNMIKHYDELERLFEEMPNEFSSGTASSKNSLHCKDAKRIKGTH